MSSRHLFFRPTTTDVHRDVRKSDAGADMVFMCLDRTWLRTLPTWIPYGFFRPMNNPICIVPYLEIAMFNIDMQKKLFLDDLHLKNSYFQWLFLITIGIQRVLEQENTWKGLERWHTVKVPEPLKKFSCELMCTGSSESPYSVHPSTPAAIAAKISYHRMGPKVSIHRLLSTWSLREE